MRKRSTPYLVALNITTFGLTLWSNVTNPNLYQYKLEHLIAHESVNTLLGLYAIGGLLTATIAQPVLGLLSDRTHSRFGRRAPYLIIGAVGVVVALLAIAGAASVGALFGAILFGQVASNTIQGPWQALSPDNVPDSQKGASAGIKTIFEVLAVLVSGLAIRALLASDQITLLVLIVSVISIVTALLPVLTTPDSSAPATRSNDTSNTPGLTEVITTLRRINLRDQRNMAWWLLNRFLFWAGLIAVRGFILGYLQDVGRYTENAAQAISGDFTILLGVGVLVATLPAGLLSDRVGRVRIIALSSLVACVAAVLLIFARQADPLRLAALLAGAGVGMYFSVNWALVTALVPVRDAALFLGIANMATTLGSAVGQLGGPLIDTINRATGTVNGYFVLFGLAALFFLLSAAAISQIDEHAPGAAASAPTFQPEV